MKIDGLNYPKISSIADGDLEFVIDLLDTFIVSVSKDIDSFEHSCQKGDKEGMQQIAHKLRTSFLLLSVDDLFNISIEIEHGHEPLKKERNESYIQSTRNLIETVKVQHKALLP